jgi:hypothetical protein
MGTEDTARAKPARRRLSRLLVPDATPGVGPAGRVVSAAVPPLLLAWPAMLLLGVLAGWQHTPALALPYWQTVLAMAPVAVGVWLAREAMLRRQTRSARPDRWQERQARRG